MKNLAVIIFIFIVLAAGLGLYVRRELHVLGTPAEGLIIEVPHGLGAREIVGLLKEKNVIQSSPIAFAYIVLTGTRHKLQAGEYLFDHPQTIPEVVHELASGMVYLHRFTVAEGLTIEAISQKWEQDGFGSEAEFRKAAADATSLVRKFDAQAVSAEGYLFPETYSFPAHTTARQVIESMISRFQQTIDKLRQVEPEDKWPLSLHDTVILASLVETEAARPEERPIIASVYLNRLRQHVLLQCDPTVIYALAQADRYQGRLTVSDLQFRSPYNTYVNPGLPPGPIANPGYASLMAAIQPAETKYFYFVRTTEERHTFSETLAAHNKAVAAYRKMKKIS